MVSKALWQSVFALGRESSALLVQEVDLGVDMLEGNSGNLTQSTHRHLVEKAPQNGAGFVCFLVPACGAADRESPFARFALKTRVALRCRAESPVCGGCQIYGHTVVFTFRRLAVFSTCSPIQVVQAPILLAQSAVVLDGHGDAAFGAGVATLFARAGYFAVQTASMRSTTRRPSPIEGVRRQAEQRAARVSAKIDSEAPDGLGQPSPCGPRRFFRDS